MGFRQVETAAIEASLVAPLPGRESVVAYALGLNKYQVVEVFVFFFER